MEQTALKKKFFSNHDLFSLFLPLIIEQGLEYTVGMAASMMVAQVGERIKPMPPKRQTSL